MRCIVALLVAIPAAALVCPPCDASACKNPRVYKCTRDAPYYCASGLEVNMCSRTQWPTDCDQCCDASSCINCCATVDPGQFQMCAAKRYQCGANTFCPATFDCSRSGSCSGQCPCATVGQCDENFQKCCGGHVCSAGYCTPTPAPALGATATETADNDKWDKATFGVVVGGLTLAIGFFVHQHW